MSCESIPQQLPTGDWQSPMGKNSSGERVLRFYYFDAMESDPIPGKVHLFGKIYHPTKNTYVSGCVIVPVERRFYLLPKETINPADPDSLSQIINEFSSDVAKWDIKDITTNLVRKKYAFHLENVPEEATYVEVRYPGQHMRIPNDYKNNSIQCIFGNSANALEILFTERTIKGPCWLEIKFSELLEGSQTTKTCCHYQVECDNMNNIRVIEDENGKELEIPRMVSTTLNITTAVTTLRKYEEIVMIHMITDRELDISGASNSSQAVDECCFIIKPSSYVGCPTLTQQHLKNSKCAQVILCKNEKNLLMEFLEKFNSVDPDILIGFNSEPPLMHLFNRLKTLGSESYKINRIRRPISSIAKIGKRRNILEKMFSRPICDVQLAIGEIKPKISKLNLDGVCSKILNTKVGTVRHINPNRIIPRYKNPSTVYQLVDDSRNETLCMMELAYKMNLIPLAVEITKTAGYVLSKTLEFGKMERNEFLFLHAFYEDGFIIPDKCIHKKIPFKGGLVLESITGLDQDLVHLVDFKSLYPSIIREYNLCFSTIEGAGYKHLDNIKLPSQNVKQGTIPRIMARLIETRKQAKITMKDPNASPEIKEQCEIKQSAIKLLSNTLYGCMGSTLFRFYCPNISAQITSKGRGILSDTADIAKSCNFTVLYGDTDSLMIKTNEKDLSHANTVAHNFMGIVNKKYKYIELELEAVFRHLLIANMKNYTGMFFKDPNDDKSELCLVAKGTLPRENQYCEMINSAVVFVMEKLFTDEPFDKRLDNIKKYFEEIGDKVKKEDWAQLRPSLVITRELLEEPVDRLPTNPAPMILACRINALTKTEKDKFREGDLISFIICDDDTDRDAKERAYLTTEEQWPPDIDYYFFDGLIKSALQKFCKAIPKLNPLFFARCLGIEKKYREFEAYKVREKSKIKLQPLVFQCQKCHIEISVEGFTRLEDEKYIPVLSSCINPDCSCAPWSYIDTIKLNLLELLRHLIRKYQRGKQLICKNRKCTYESDDIDMLPDNCPKCSRKNSIILQDRIQVFVYRQIEYLREWFDVGIQNKTIQDQLDGGPVEMIMAYNSLWELVNFVILQAPLRLF